MSRTGSGAVLALSAVGKQDSILTELGPYNREATPWKRDHTQFSHYTKFYKTYTRDKPEGVASWPFQEGQVVTFEIDPRTSGDLMTNAFLKVDLPALPNEGDMWTDKLGRALIKSVEFRVDSVVVEKLNDLDLIVRDELMTSEHDNAIRNYCQNGQVYVDSTREENYLVNPPILPLSPDHRAQSQHMYINLGLCFSRTHEYKPEAFPLSAVFRQKVYVSIEFRPREWFTNSTVSVIAPRLVLVTEQVTLPERERIYVQRNPFSLVYKTIERKLIAPTDKDADTFSQTGGSTGSVSQITVQLKNERPVSSVAWFFQNRRFTQVSVGDTTNSNLFLNRFNFSAHENFTAVNPLEDGYTGEYYGLFEDNYPLCSQIQLLNPKQDLKLLYTGSDNKTIPSTSVFFRDIYSQVRGLYRPTKNIFTFSWEENPMLPHPSGSVAEDIKEFKVENILINTDEVLANVYDLHLYNICYTTLNFEDGMLLKKI